MSDLKPITCLSQALQVITSILTRVCVPFQPSPSLGLHPFPDEGFTLSLAVSSIPRKLCPLPASSLSYAEIAS